MKRICMIFLILSATAVFLFGQTPTPTPSPTPAPRTQGESIVLRDDDGDTLLELATTPHTVNVSDPVMSDGFRSIFLGQKINKESTGTTNMVFGNTETPRPALTGAGNTAFGYGSGWQMTSARGNAFFGQGSGARVETGWGNTALGYGSGGWNKQGSQNTYVGYRAGTQQSNLGQYLTERNVYVGFEAGYQAQQGSNNTAVGFFAGRSATGSGNVFIGYGAGRFESRSNVLSVCNEYNNCLIDASFGIPNEAAPTFKLKEGTKLFLPAFGPLDNTCQKGQVSYSLDALYICVADGQPRKAALTSIEP